MRQILFALTCSCLAFWARPSLGSEQLVPPLEIAGYSRLSTSAEISAYLHRLAEAFPQARVETVGQSVLGRPIEALIISQPATIASPRADRVTVEIVGSQHGMEGAGAETLLFIAGDLLSGSLQHLLEDIDVVLVPNSNPDGLESGKRVNANHININTDFIALSQPESRALVATLERYRPEVALDVHESAVLKKQSLALEGYMTNFTTQFEIANNPNIVPSLREFALEGMLTPWIARVDAAGLNSHRYFGEIRSRSQPVTNGGLSLQNLRNRAGIEGTLSFLMETRLDPKHGVYPTYRNIAVRVAMQRISIEKFLTVVYDRRQQILDEVAKARRAAGLIPLALEVRYVAEPADPPVPIELRRISDGELERIEFRDSRTVAVAMPLPMPAAYLVRGQQSEIASLLDRQGIRYERLESPRSFRSVEFVATPSPTSSLGNLQERDVRVQAKPGDLWIDVGQKRGRLAALILEPGSASSLFQVSAYSALVRPEKPLPVYRIPR